jgi:predicted nucleic acid-binding protein
LIAVDTSVVVAGFASWHDGHGAAAAVLARRPRLAAHVLVESYSVLTRLPAPHTASAAVVDEFLRHRFPQAPLVLPAKAYGPLLRTIASSGVQGGAAYDALIAATARHANALLLTRDRRASATYEKIGVRFELVQ